MVVDGVDLEVKAGEIVGLAGVEGNGQEELVEAIVGVRTPRGGRVLVGGHDLTRMGTKRTLHAGLSFIPADRHRMGVILELPVGDNLVLSDYDRPPFARGLLRRFEPI